MIYSELFKDVCELYEMVSLSKCSPFAFADQSMSLDTRDGKALCCYYWEHYRLGKEREDPVTVMGNRILFPDFDENNIEHQKKLSSAIMSLKMQFKKRKVPPFYKSMLYSYDSSSILLLSELNNIFKQLSSVMIYREVFRNLLDLDLDKDFFFEMPVDENNKDGYKLRGRMLFYIRGSNKGNFLDVSMWKGFHLNEGEAEKLEKIVRTWGLRIHGIDHTKDYPKNRLPNMTLEDLKEITII